jgi:hypothetical protein
LVAPATFMSDQPYNAKMVNKLNIGLGVSESVYRRRATQLLADLLKSERIRAGIQQYSPLAAKGADYSAAIDAIEALLPPAA